MQARLMWPSCSICGAPDWSAISRVRVSPTKQLSVLCDAFQYPFENLFLDEKEALLPYKERIKLLINKIIDYDG